MAAASCLKQASVISLAPPRPQPAQQPVEIDAAQAMQVAMIVAWRLKERGVLRRSEVEDFAGDLVAELVQRWPQYEPGRSGVPTFMFMVTQNRARSLLRSRWSAKRGGGRCRNFTDLGVKNLETLANRAHRCAIVPDPAPQAALRMDVDAVVARLPEHLQRVCAFLKELSPAEAAQKLGIPRHRLYALIREIRRHSIAAGWEGPA